MKNNILKTLLLGAMSIGMLTGCNFGKDSSSTSYTPAPNSSLSSNVMSSSELSSSLPTPSSSSSNSSSSAKSSSSSQPSSSASSSSSSSSQFVKTLIGISLNTDNVKKSYKVGEAFSTNGLVVTAAYNDDSKEVVDQYQTSPANGAILNQAGENKVTVTYQGKTAEFTINVAGKESISLTHTFVKKDYEQGEALDLTNLKVVLKYTDGKTEEVKNYTTNPADGAILNEIGTVTVTVTYESLTAAFDVTVNKPTKKDWTSEEAKIMSDNLYGIVLPYTGLEESKVSYDAKSEILYIKGGKVVDDTDNEEGTLLKYARALSYMGFTFTGGNSYIFVKQNIETDAGLRALRIAFGADEDGNFTLSAYDPYYYSFPTDFALYVAYSYFGSTVIVPAFEGATRYVCSLDYQAILCDINAETEDAGYTAVLSAAGWDTKGKDEDLGAYVAGSPDGKYSVRYIYSDGVFQIYFAPALAWNADSIKAFYEKYNCYAVEIPALEAQGATYQFTESEYNEYYAAEGRYDSVYAFMVVYGAKRSDLETYIETLKTAGWVVSEGNQDAYSAKIVIPNVGVAKIGIAFSGSYISITLTASLDPIPENDFPSEEVAEVLGPEITDTVPVFYYENAGFSVMNTYSEGDFVSVQVEEGKEWELANAYIEYAKSLGYELYKSYSTVYVSPNGQILLQAYRRTVGEIMITFKPLYTTWPTARIARAINETLGKTITDILPAFYNANVDRYFIEEEDDGLYIRIVFEEDEDVETDIMDYATTLSQKGYVEAYVDEQGDTYYASPSMQFAVCPYEDWGDLYLYIPIIEDEDTWPQDDIDTFFTTKGYTDPLPVYEGEYISATFESDPAGNNMIAVHLGADATLEDCLLAASAYKSQLTQAQFTYVESDDFNGTTYRSPNGQYDVRVAGYTGGFDITFYSSQKEDVVTNEFPLDLIVNAWSSAAEDFPEYDWENVVNFETEDYGEEEGYIGVYANYESFEQVETAYDEIVDALVKAGYTAKDMWGVPGYTGYFSPDNTYCIQLETSETHKCLALYFYDCEYNAL